MIFLLKKIKKLCILTSVSVNVCNCRRANNQYCSFIEFVLDTTVLLWYVLAVEIRL